MMLQNKKNLNQKKKKMLNDINSPNHSYYPILRGL